MISSEENRTGSQLLVWAGIAVFLTIAVVVIFSILPGTEVPSGEDVLLGGTVVPAGDDLKGGEAKSTGSIAEGRKVNLIEESGDFALVEYRGQQVYVQTSMLKHKNTAALDQGGEGQSSHTINRDTPTFKQLPTKTPALPEPRSRPEIHKEQNSLNSLFFTERTLKEVIAPSVLSADLVDATTGERCWRVYECLSPDCPGEKKGRRIHYLFIKAKMNQRLGTVCDACLGERDQELLSHEESAEMSKNVRVYQLPETARRLRELDTERRALIAKQRKRDGR